MDIILLLAVATIPVLVILWMMHRQDHRHKEPRHLLMRAFWYGVLVTIPAALLGILLEEGYALVGLTHPWVYIVLTSFVTAAFIEETGKLLVFKKAVFHEPAFDEVLDGVIYGVFVSLGFAFLENILYVLSDGLGTGIARAFLAVPAHGLFGGWMGYYVGKGMMTTGSERRRFIAKGLFWAWLLHGVYNFCLFTESILALLVIPLLIVGYRMLFVRIRAIQEETPSKATHVVSATGEQLQGPFWKLILIRLWGVMLVMGMGLFLLGLLLVALEEHTLGMEDVFLAISACGLFVWGVKCLLYKIGSSSSQPEYQ